MRPANKPRRQPNVIQPLFHASLDAHFWIAPPSADVKGEPCTEQAQHAPIMYGTSRTQLTAVDQLLLCVDHATTVDAEAAADAALVASRGWQVECHDPTYVHYYAKSGTIVVHNGVARLRALWKRRITYAPATLKVHPGGEYIGVGSTVVGIPVAPFVLRDGHEFHKPSEVGLSVLLLPPALISMWDGTQRAIRYTNRGASALRDPALHVDG